MRLANPVKSCEGPATAPSRVIPLIRYMPISRKELIVDVEPEPMAASADDNEAAESLLMLLFADDDEP